MKNPLKLENNKLSYWLFSFFKAFLITGTLLSVGATYWYQLPNDNPKKTIVIPKSASLSQITSLLTNENILNSPFLFRVTAFISGSSRKLKAGEYIIPPSITPSQLISILKSGEVVLHSITLIEGETSHHFTEKLRNNVEFSGDCKVPAEGSLLPNTYHFAKGTDREVVLNHMQNAMKTALESLEPITLTKKELVTLASIVEKETCLPRERPIVAAVFLNRLKKGMPLQADPTVIYALTKGECDLGRALCRTDLKIECPYNTYTQKGLPPLPIANPGYASLKAVVNPANVDFLFFVADGTGGHIFATSLKDHQKNHAAWRIKRNEISGKK